MGTNRTISLLTLASVLILAKSPLFPMNQGNKLSDPRYILHLPVFAHLAFLLSVSDSTGSGYPFRSVSSGYRFHSVSSGYRFLSVSSSYSFHSVDSCCLLPVHSYRPRSINVTLHNIDLFSLPQTRALTQSFTHIFSTFLSRMLHYLTESDSILQKEG